MINRKTLHDQSYEQVFTRSSWPRSAVTNPVYPGPARLPAGYSNELNYPFVVYVIDSELSHASKGSRGNKAMTGSGAISTMSIRELLGLAGYAVEAAGVAAIVIGFIVSAYWFFGLSTAT
jgi:hypothetical protein